MKWLSRALAFALVGAAFVPAGAAGPRPLVCEAAGTFKYVAIVDPWWPVELHATGSCTGDLGGPYRVAIDGAGIADELARCSHLSNALMDVTVTLTNTNTGKTVVLDQKWNIYFTAFSSVGVIVIRAPISGSGLMLTRLFNAITCLQDEGPDPPYQSAAVFRWAFVR